MIDYTSVLVAAIITLPPTIMALLAWRASKQNTAAITEVHLSINSRMSQLLKASTGEAKAEGREQGRAEKKKKLP